MYNSSTNVLSFIFSDFLFCFAFDLKPHVLDQSAFHTISYRVDHITMFLMFSSGCDRRLRYIVLSGHLVLPRE